LVRTEPSLFCVGGSQSRVATPVVVVVFTGGVTLVFEATVPVPEVVPAVPVAEPDEEAVPEVFEATAVAGDTIAVFDAEVFSVASTPCDRSIIPMFGDTRLATESDAVEVAAALLESDPPPQAARVSVARVPRTRLRICERA
jgi:hypothetical protein